MDKCVNVLCKHILNILNQAISAPPVEVKGICPYNTAVVWVLDLAGGDARFQMASLVSLIRLHVPSSNTVLHTLHYFLSHRHLGMHL